jgi:hypothetical protein
VTDVICEFIKVIVEELRVTKKEFDKFVFGLVNLELAKAFTQRLSLII